MLLVLLILYLPSSPFFHQQIHVTLQAFCTVGATNGSNGSAANQPPPAWPGRVVVPEVTKTEGVKVPIACASLSFIDCAETRL